jgi:lysyl-tRNA synthetase class 1
MLDVVPPEVIRYVLVRTDPMKHKDFDWAKIPQLVDEFERIERIYYDLDEPSPREDPEEMRRLYELSLVRMPPQKDLVQIPYGHLLTLVQLYPEFGDLVGVLRRGGELDADIDPPHLQCIREKAENARAWVRYYAPEAMRFTLMDELTPEARGMLSPAQADYLRTLAGRLGSTDWEGQEIHDEVHGLSKEVGLKARDAFGAVYIAMLGKTRGPRVGYFLASMERDWVVDRFKDAAG